MDEDLVRVVHCRDCARAGTIECPMAYVDTDSLTGEPYVQDANIWPDGYCHMGIIKVKGGIPIEDI